MNPVEPDEILERPTFADKNLGTKMAALAKERGLRTFGPGRRPIAEKYRAQVEEAESTLAEALPETVRAYIRELYNLDPEQCSVHKVVLSCNKCGEKSQRRVFNHAAAAYHMDRMLGKPTSRSENTLTIKLVQGVLIDVAEMIEECNGIDDETNRALAFAERCRELHLRWASG